MFQIAQCLAQGITHLVYIGDLIKGVRAQYIEVLITAKPDKASALNDIP